MNLHNGNQETMLTSALERKPEVAVPGDFHVRLRAAVAGEPARRTRTNVGTPISFARATAYVAALSLAIALAVLTSLHPNAIKAPNSMTFILELILLSQLMAIAFWLGVRRGR